MLGLATSLALHHYYTTEQIIEFGWRIPFVAGGLVGLLSFVVRRQLIESPVYRQMLDEKQQLEHKLPLKTLFTRYPRQLLGGFLLTGAGASAIMIFFLFLPTYLGKVLHYPIQDVLESTTLSLLAGCVLILCCGLVIDKLAKRLNLWLSLALIISMALVLISYSLYQSHAPLLLPMLLSALAIGMIWSLTSTLLSLLFPVPVRYSGIGLVYNIAFATIGGLAPAIALSLIDLTGSTLAPAYYHVGASALGLIGLGLLGSIRLPRRVNPEAAGEESAVAPHPLS